MSALFVGQFEPVTRPASLPNALARLMLSVTGTALGCSAFGIWLVPAGGGLPDLSLVKLGLSLGFLLGGLCCVVIARDA